MTINDNTARIVAHLRRRRGDIVDADKTVECPHHKVQPLADFSFNGEIDRFCEQCLRTFLAPFKADSSDTPTTAHCKGCQVVNKALFECEWCEEKFCMQCMKGESCLACDAEAAFPPDARTAEPILRGS